MAAEGQKRESFEVEEDPERQAPQSKKEGEGGSGGNNLKKWLEWGGQSAASLFWIISVFVYGIEGTGDILQLCAALSWFFANMASLLPE